MEGAAQCLLCAVGSSAFNFMYLCKYQLLPQTRLSLNIGSK